MLALEMLIEQLRLDRIEVASELQRHQGQVGDAFDRDSGLDRFAALGQNVGLHCPVHTCDSNGGQKSANRGWDQADQKGDQSRNMEGAQALG